MPKNDTNLYSNINYEEIIELINAGDSIDSYLEKQSVNTLNNIKHQITDIDNLKFFINLDKLKKLESKLTIYNNSIDSLKLNKKEKASSIGRNTLGAAVGISATVIGFVSSIPLLIGVASVAFIISLLVGIIDLYSFIKKNNNKKLLISLKMLEQYILKLINQKILEEEFNKLVSHLDKTISNYYDKDKIDKNKFDIIDIINQIKIDFENNPQYQNNQAILTKIDKIKSKINELKLNSIFSSINNETSAQELSYRQWRSVKVSSSDAKSPLSEASSKFGQNFAIGVVTLLAAKSAGLIVTSSLLAGPIGIAIVAGVALAVAGIIYGLSVYNTFKEDKRNFKIRQTENAIKFQNTIKDGIINEIKSEINNINSIINDLKQAKNKGELKKKDLKELSNKLKNDFTEKAEETKGQLTQVSTKLDQMVDTITNTAPQYVSQVVVINAPSSTSVEPIAKTILGSTTKAIKNVLPNENDFIKLEEPIINNNADLLELTSLRPLNLNSSRLEGNVDELTLQASNISTDIVPLNSSDIDIAQQNYDIKSADTNIIAISALASNTNQKNHNQGSISRNDDETSSKEINSNIASTSTLTNTFQKNTHPTAKFSLPWGSLFSSRASCLIPGVKQPFTFLHSKTNQQHDSSGESSEDFAQQINDNIDDKIQL